MSRNWWVRRLFARRPSPVVRLSINRLEDRTTPALLLGYTPAALSLTETTAGDDAVQFSEVGSNLRIFLFGGATFDPASITGPLFTYQTPGDPGASQFVDMDLSDPAVLAATTIDTGGGSDVVFLNVPTLSLGQTTVTSSTADESVAVVLAANTTGLTLTAKSVQVNGTLANTGPNAVVLASTASANAGAVLVFGSITSDDGDIILSGDATGVGPFTQGVLVAGGSTITTTGTGNISITGAGGTDSFGAGVVIDGGSVVEAAGSGSVFISGSGGGSPDGQVNFGVFVGDGGSVVRTAGGSITLLGSPGQGAFSAGISIQDDGSVVSNGGPVTFVSDSVNIDTDPDPNPPDSGFTPGIGTVDAGTGGFTVRPRTDGTAIDLGADDSPGTLGLTAAELAQVTASDLRIGSPTSGNLTLSADITLASLSHVILFAGGRIASTPAAGSFNTAGGSLLLRPSGVYVPARAGTDVTALSLDFAPNTAVTLAVNGPTPDSGYDRLVVAGTANLFQTRLAFTGTYTPGPTETLTVVSATSVTNTFLDAPDGAVVVVNGRPMQVRYTATAVTLTAVPTLSATIDGSGNLVVADTAGLPDRLTVRLSGTNLIVTDATEQFAAAPPGGTLSDGGRTLTLPLSAVSGQLLFNTGGGNDVLTVDQAGGAIPRPIVFDGGDPTIAPGDKLVVTGGSFGTVTHTFLDSSSGLLTFDNSLNTIRYTGLEPVDMTGTTAAALVFNLPAAASAAVLEDDGTPGNGVSQLRSGNGTFETTTFSSPAGGVTINRGNAADTLAVTDLPDFTAGLTVGEIVAPFAAVDLGGAVTLANRPLAVVAGLASLSNGAAVATGGADAVILADAMSLDNGTLSAGDGRVILQPLTTGATLDLGGADAPGVLGLTAAELDHITAGVLRVGSIASAGLTVSAPIAPTGTGRLELVAGGFPLGGAITATAAAPAVTVARLTLSGWDGVYGSAPGTPFTVDVDNLDGNSANGGFAVLNVGDLTVGGTGGVFAGLSAAGDVLLSVTPSGTLTVTQPVTGGGANVELTADRLLLTAPVSAPTAGVGNVRLLTASAGLPINLGATTDLPGSLSISNAEFQLLTAGRLVQVGLGDDPLAGPIGVSAPITAPAGVSALVLASGSDITQSLAGTLTVPSLGVALINPVTTVILTAANAVSVFAALAVNDPAHVLPTGTISFVSTLPLTIGQVGSIVGLTAGTAAVSTTGNALTLTDPVVTDGGLTLGVATAGGGGTATVPGSLLTVPGGVTLFGGAGDDTFNVSGSAKTAITVDGKAPVLPAQPGDTLNYIPAGGGLAIAPNTTGAVLTEPGLKAVSFVSIETFALAAAAGPVTVEGSPAAADFVKLFRDATDTFTYFQYSADNGATFGQKFRVTWSPFVFNGNGGTTAVGGKTRVDTLRVSYTGGDPLAPLSGVQFTGVPAGGGLLSVQGSRTAAARDARYLPSGTTKGSGTVTLTDPAGVAAPKTITFAGLSPVDLFGLATVTVALPGANDVLTVANGFDFATNTKAALIVSGTSGGVGIEPAAIWANTTLVIDTAAAPGVDGKDTVTINAADNNHLNTNVRVFTGTGADLVPVLGPVIVAGDFEVRSADIGIAADVTAGKALTLTNTGTLTLGTVTLKAASVSQTGPGPVVLVAGTVTVPSPAVSFASPIDGAADGVGTLDVQAGTGSVSLGGSVGATGRPAAVSVAGASIQLAGTVYQTTGDQVYTGLVTVSAPTVRFDSAGGDVRFQPAAGGTDVLTAATAGSTAVTVVANKAAVFGGGVGRPAALGSLAVTAADIRLGGDVTTAGPQTYLGPVVLTADVTLTGSELLFAGTVDGDATPNPNRTLTVTVTDPTKAATFKGQIGAGSPGNLPPFTTQALQSLTVNGAARLAGFLVQTVGDQTFTGPVTLTGPVLFRSVPATDYTFSDGTGAINFAGPVDGATAGGQDLLVFTTGPIAFGGAVGSKAPLRSLQVGNGPTTVSGGSVTTTGPQTYIGELRLGADAVLTATNPPPVNAGDIRFQFFVSSAAGAGPFGLTVNTPGGGTTTFDLPVSDLSFLRTDAPGRTVLNTTFIGTTGEQTFGDPVTLAQPLQLLTATGPVRFGGTLDKDPAVVLPIVRLTVSNPGLTTFDGQVGGLTPLDALLVEGSARVNGGLVRTVGEQSFAGPTTLGKDTTFQADGVGSGIGFSTLDSVAPRGTAGATFVVPPAGEVFFIGAIGGSVPLAFVKTNADGQTRLTSGPVATTGDQTFGNPVLVTGTVTFQTVDPLTGAAPGTGAITFAGTLDGGGTGAVRVTTAGAITFGGAVGAAPLASLLVDGGGKTVVAGGAVTTVSAQTFLNPVVLAALPASAATPSLTRFTTQASSGSAIRFGSTLDAATADFQGAVFDSLTGVEFDGAVGGLARLALLRDMSRGALVKGGLVNTAGEQFYLSTVTLGNAPAAGKTTADTRFTSATGRILFGGQLNAAAQGVQGATVLTAGDIVFNGQVGAIPLAFLTTGGGGRTIVDGGSVVTVGDQTYNEPVTATGGRSITFATVDPAGVDPCGTGAIRFLPPAGQPALTAAGFVTIRTMGLTEFLGPVTVGGLLFDCPGPIDLNGGTVDTGTGPQSYAGDVVLTTDTTLIAGSVTFGGRLDAEAKTAWRLNILAPATFKGAVGGLAPLGRLDVAGAATVGGKLVRTTDSRLPAGPGEGSQNYVGPVTVTADTLFDVVGKATGAISFLSTLDSDPAGFAVRVTTAGDTVFGGSVGNASPLGELATDGGGVTVVRGERVRTSAFSGRSGSQLYGDDVRVAGPAVEFAADVVNPGPAPLPPDVQAVRFAGRLDAAAGTSPAVTVSAPGDVTLGGPVGGLAPLGSLDVTGVGDLAVNGGGTTTVGGGSVTTAGRQRYAQRTVLAGDTTFTAGGDVLFDNRLDAAAAGKAAADIRAPGLTRFRGEVGLTSALSSVTTDKFGSVEFAGALVRTTDKQTYLDPARVTIGTEFRSLGDQAIRFDQTLDGPRAALVTTAGPITFQGKVGGTTPLEGLLAGSGPIAVNGGLVRVEPSFGSIRLQGPVTLGADTTFDAKFTSGTEQSGAVFFTSTLTGPGKAVVVNSQATTLFGGDVTVGSLTTDDRGITRIATAKVTATGTIEFGDAASGDAPAVTITGGSVLFRSLLNGPNTDVTVNSDGLTEFDYIVQVKSLTTDAPGTTAINFRGEQFSTGSQVYGDPVTLGNRTVVFRSTGSGRVVFGQTLTGPDSDVQVDTSGDTVFNGGVDVGSLHSYGGGETLVNGGIVRTARSQRYDDPVTVGKQAVVFQDGGAGVVFVRELDGVAGSPQAVTLRSPGANAVVGSIGLAAPLAALTLDGGSTTLVNGAVRTLGGVTQQSGTVTATTLTLLGGGTTVIDSPGNQVANFTAALDNGSVRLSTAGDLRLVGSGVKLAGGGFVRIRTGGNFIADVNTDTSVVVDVTAGGQFVVYPGLNGDSSKTTNPSLTGATVVFTVPATASQVVLGLPTAPPDKLPSAPLPSEAATTGFKLQANTLADRFTVRPSANAPFFVYGNAPRPPLTGTAGDSLRPDFAGAAVTQFQYDGQDGFYDVAGAKRLTFSSIEALTGLSQAAFVAQTGEPGDGTGATTQQYNVRVVSTQNGTPLPGGLSGARLPDNPFVVSPALVNPAASTQPPRVAFGDFNGDNVVDLVLANGPGTPPLVTVIDGRVQNLPPRLVDDRGVIVPDGSKAVVSPSDPKLFTVTRPDGTVTQARLVPSPLVNIADLRNLPESLRNSAATKFTVIGSDGTVSTGAVLQPILAQFYAYDPGFQGGVNVAVGRLGPTGGFTITTGAETGGGPHVRTFELVPASGQPTPLVSKQLTTSFGNFFAYEPTFTGGVRVAVADVTGDGVDDLVLAAGPGGGPRVRVFDGATTGAGTAELSGFTPAYADFFTVEPTFRGGLYVAAGFYRGEPQAGSKADIVVGVASGGGPRVMIFDGRTVTTGNAAPAQLANFFAFSPQEQNDPLFGGTDYFTGVGGVAFGGRAKNGYLDVLVSTGRGPQLKVRRFAGEELFIGQELKPAASGGELTDPTLSQYDGFAFSLPPLVSGTTGSPLNPKQLTYGATVGGAVV